MHSVHVLYALSCLKDKNPFGTVFMAAESLAFHDKLPAFKSWYCHLLCVIVIDKIGVIIVGTSLDDRVIN